MTERTDAAADDDGADATATDGAGRPSMRDVSHTPPDGDGTNDVWVRGGDAPPVREPTDE